MKYVYAVLLIVLAFAFPSFSTAAQQPSQHPSAANSTALQAKMNALEKTVTSAESMMNRLKSEQRVFLNENHCDVPREQLMCIMRFETLNADQIQFLNSYTKSVNQAASVLTMLKKSSDPQSYNRLKTLLEREEAMHEFQVQGGIISLEITPSTTGAMMFGISQRDID